MSVTLEIPTHFFKRANKYASLQGISLDTLIVQYLEHVEHLTAEPIAKDSFLHNNSDKFGLFRGSVRYMADDFNATPEEFKDYV